MELDTGVQARQRSAEAMAWLDRLDIPPTPANYQVWYAYAAGQDRDLVRALDILISNGDAFDEARCLEISEQFFGNDAGRESVRAAGKRLETLASTLMDQLDSARTQAGDFGSAVADLSDSVAQDCTVERLREVATALVAEAHAVVAGNARLQRHLGHASKEASDLRQSLVSMRREATTDPLTGLANRREFDRRLRIEAIQAAESGAPLSLILFDIDHFKAFNDRYGHAIGDEVLKLVATRLRENLKGRDLLVRHGGEEFAVLLAGTDTDAAMVVAEQIRRSLNASTVRHRVSGESYGNIAATFGVARYEPGESLAGFLERADAALYRGKRAGRDRVVCACDATGQAAATAIDPAVGAV